VNGAVRAFAQLRANHARVEILLVFCLIFFQPFFFFVGGGPEPVSPAVLFSTNRLGSFVSSDFFDSISVIFSDFERERKREK